MSQNLRNYVRAIYAFDAVVNRVPADAWDNQTACDAWTAREVVGHTIWGARRMASIATQSESPAEQAEAEIAGADPAASWNAARDQVLAALDTQGALQQTFDAPIGQMTLDQAAGMFLGDPLLHAWDIAAACDIEAAIPEDLAAGVTAGLAMMGDDMRRPGMFGAQVEVADDASVIDKWVAMAGRTPAS